MPNTYTDKEIWQNGYHSVSISAYNGNTLVGTITNDDIVQGTFKVNNAICDGDKLSFGGCIATTMEMSLMNSEGEFDDWTFPGLKLSTTITATYEGETATLSLPSMTVENSPVMEDVITITAYDDFVKLDYSLGDKAFMDSTYGNYTVYNLLSTMLGLINCSIASSTYTSNYCLASTTVKQFADGVAYTPRSVIRWCCELLGAVCYLTNAGAVVERFHTGETASNLESVMKADKFSSSRNHPVTVKSATYSFGGVSGRYGNTLAQGELDYSIDVEDNPLILWTGDVTQNTADHIAECIFLNKDYSGTQKATNVSYGGASGHNIAYTPCEITSLPVGYLLTSGTYSGYGFPIRHELKDGTMTNAFVTNITFGLNSQMALSSIGTTEVADTTTSSSVFSQSAVEEIKKYATTTEGQIDIIKAGSGITPEFVTAIAKYEQSAGRIILTVEYEGDTYAKMTTDANGTDIVKYVDFCIKPSNWDSMSALEKIQYYASNTFTNPCDRKIANGYRSDVTSSGFGVYEQNEDTNEYELKCGVAAGGLMIDGDIMTDFIIERGTSGNWVYTKWKSGACDLDFIGTVSFPRQTTLDYSQYTRIDFPFTVYNAIGIGTATSWFAVCNITTHDTYFNCRISKTAGLSWGDTDPLSILVQFHFTGRWTQ